MKIKPEEPKDFKAFEIEVNEVEYKTRCWIIDTYQDYIEQGKNPPFSYYGDIVLKCTFSVIVVSSTESFSVY